MISASLCGKILSREFGYEEEQRVSCHLYTTVSCTFLEMVCNEDKITDRGVLQEHPVRASFNIKSELQTYSLIAIHAPVRIKSCTKSRRFPISQLGVDWAIPSPARSPYPRSSTTMRTIACFWVTIVVVKKAGVGRGIFASRSQYMFVC